MSALFGRSRSVLSRLVGALVVVLGVVTLTFFLARVVSPDPTNLYVSPQADQATRDQVRAMMGLDKPVLEQYVTYLGQLVRGDLGTSFSTGQPVRDDLLSRLPATLELATYSLIIGTLVGVVVGIVGAVRRGGILDHTGRFVTVAGLALPQFFVGLMLLWIFFVVLGIAPGPVGRLPVGLVDPPQTTGFVVIDALLSGQWAVAGAALQQLALPLITLAFAIFAPIARTVRTAMLEALDADYVRTATAMGLPQRTIHYRYALKNVLLPVLTMLAGVIGFAFSGAVLVEGVFAWPGIGQYALDAIQQSDFAAIQGFVLYAAVLYVVVYLLLDLLYARVDPRVRL
ncbi:ABC transporter permease [Nakamurella leprariae]|uniref:ABC transporter permease n=1 Tax=Nakamurella leprariae TaxID=2803911 RepID=A0A938YDI0_9ACTN|nr:ABC transporter permease [Nakamurella leprariae]MBM9465860.1 ABC transporter permease [Nakamurella leprariae]